MASRSRVKCDLRTLYDNLCLHNNNLCTFTNNAHAHHFLVSVPTNICLQDVVSPLSSEFDAQVGFSHRKYMAGFGLQRRLLQSARPVWPARLPCISTVRILLRVAGVHAWPPNTVGVALSLLAAALPCCPLPLLAHSRCLPQHCRVAHSHCLPQHCRVAHSHCLRQLALVAGNCTRGGIRLLEA